MAVTGHDKILACDCGSEWPKLVEEKEGRRPRIWSPSVKRVMWVDSEIAHHGDVPLMNSESEAKTAMGSDPEVHDGFNKEGGGCLNWWRKRLIREG